LRFGIRWRVRFGDTHIFVEVSRERFRSAAIAVEKSYQHRSKIPMSSTSGRVITKVVAGEGHIMGFTDGLYRAGCSECGEGLSWEANFDADGTNYYATCCGRRHVMRPYEVIITVDEA
jgi:hypothetical protein